MNEDLEPVDFLVEDFGSVWRFTPQTEEAKAFSRNELPLEPWQRGADGRFSADHRPARQLAEQLQREGWHVAQVYPEPIRSEISQTKADGRKAHHGEQQEQGRDRHGDQARDIASGAVGVEAEFPAVSATEGKNVLATTDSGTQPNEFLSKCQPDDVPYPLAYNAHRGTSFVPEVRAKQRQQQYLDHMREVYDKLAELADTPDKQVLLGQELERYRQGWLEKYRDFLHADSRVVSTMIAGSSKFPAARMKKRADTADKRLMELFDFQKRAFAAMERKLAPERGPIKSADADAVEKLRAKLAKLEETQALYKKINAAHARFLKDPASLDGSDLPENIREMVRDYKPKYSWEPHPVAPYQLQNNNAEIRRLRARINEVSNMQATAHTETAYTDGISVVENQKAGRVQVRFPGKPDRETIGLMKRSGFRWSPSEGAWQRHLNSAGHQAAASVMRQLGKERLEAVSEPTKAESTTQVNCIAIDGVPIEVQEKAGAVEPDPAPTPAPNRDRSEREGTMPEEHDRERDHTPEVARPGQGQPRETKKPEEELASNGDGVTSFALEVQENGTTEWVENGLRFPAKDQAEDYGRDLFSRWSGIQSYRVIERSEPANYTFVNRHLESLNQNENSQPTQTQGSLNNGGNMGWYYTKGATKSDIIAELTKEQPRQAAVKWSNAEQRSVPCGYDFGHKTLHKCVRGSVLWTVEETVRYKDPVERDTFIACYLLKAGRGEAGYKPMDESMGPFYYSCPLAYLAMVPETNRQWRDNVRAYHAEKVQKQGPQEQDAAPTEEIPTPARANDAVVAAGEGKTTTPEAAFAEGLNEYGGTERERGKAMSKTSDTPVTEKSGLEHKPLAKLACGDIRGSVWLNQSENGAYLTLSVARVYKAPDGTTKATHSYRLEDLADLSELSLGAQKFMQEESLKLGLKQHPETQRARIAR
jgi:hypothetical protein